MGRGGRGGGVDGSGGNVTGADQEAHGERVSALGFSRCLFFFASTLGAREGEEGGLIPIDKIPGG